jgi:DNA-binding protein YbaB
MNFSTLTIAALLGTASAQCNLRANKLHAPLSSDLAEARVVIHGLTEDASREDLEIVEKSVIAAYNSAYQTAGYSLKSFEGQLSATVPDMVDWMQDDVAALKQSHEQGQLVLATVQSIRDLDCSPHDDASAMKHNLGDLHKDFENKLCASLRALGSANLANARDCSFAFLDMPGQSGESWPIETASTLTSAEKKIESQVLLHGTLHDLTKEDKLILDDIIVAAYNKAFSKAGYMLASFESVRDIDTVGWWHWADWTPGPDCRL